MPDNTPIGRDPPAPTTAWQRTVGRAGILPNACGTFGPSLSPPGDARMIVIDDPAERVHDASDLGSGDNPCPPACRPSWAGARRPNGSEPTTMTAIPRTPTALRRRSRRRTALTSGLVGAALALTGALPSTVAALGAPVSFEAGPDASVLEAGLFTRDIAIVDGNDDGEPGWTYTIEYGDGSATVGTTQTPNIELQHTYGNGPAAFIATVIVTDVTGEFASDSFNVSVQNVAPTVTITAAPASTEGAPYTIIVDATDPGDARSAISFFVDWGDGGVSVQVNRPLGPATHTYLDDPDGPVNAVTRNMLVSVYDDAGLTQLMVPVLITDVAPTIALSGAASVAVGTAYSLTLGAITDPARTDNVTSRTVNWGDGTSEVVATGGTFAHTYTISGTKSITVDLVNEDGTHLAAGSLTVAATPVLPTAPANLTATATSKSVVQLNWAHTSTGQTAVYVERCTGAGCTSFTRVATLSGTATSYRNTGLASRTTYTYRVRSRNAVGYSTYSNTAAATTLRR